MKKIFAVAFITCVSMAAFAERWTGYVSDEQCAVSGAKAKKASDWVNPNAFLACAQKCAKAGSAVVFVTEDNKILKFDADSARRVMPHLGHRVSLTGKLEGGTLRVDKIANIKMDSQAKPASDQEEKMHDKN